MARAYASFADGGDRIDGSLLGDQPRTVTRIEDGAGHVVYENRPVRRRVLSATEDAVLTQLLTGVVSSGTGRAAAIPGRAVAGKTGTTENYGDAWFVGYTPNLVTAVWVGYPDGLKPMLNEFQGGPVVGGSFPALIWKTFTQSALDARGVPAESFPQAPYLSGQARQVTYRDGRIELDNGLCRDTSVLVYFTGRGPAHTADCKRNEVDVPNVVGLELPKARARLQAQPLTPELIWEPAKPGEKVGAVLRQFPSGGTLSSFSHVRLVVARKVSAAAGSGG
jgi:membrane peptidoglycan carboxypeptidase